MQNAQITLEAMDFDVKVTAHLVQQIRQYIEVSASPISAAQRVIRNITSIDVEIPNIETAVPLAQYIAINALKAEEGMTYEALIENGFTYVSELFKKHPWASPKTDSSTAPNTVAVVEGIDVKVEVKADGKIKKGGKQILAVELYKKHVLETETPVDNQGFIKILMTELGMTKAGATTYRYNLAKQFKK